MWCLYAAPSRSILITSACLDQGLFQQVWEKARGQNWEKMINLTSKLGEINNIEHYKGSKILSSKSSYFRLLYYAKHTT